MKRTEMREHIFRMVFSYEFNSDQEMPQQMQLYFEQLDQEPKEEDMAYIRDKALNVILKSEEIDEMLNEHVTCGKRSDQKCIFKECERQPCGRSCRYQWV